jgi:hypothetical protein
MAAVRLRIGCDLLCVICWRVAPRAANEKPEPDLWTRMRHGWKSCQFVDFTTTHFYGKSSALKSATRMRALSRFCALGKFYAKLCWRFAS